MDLMATYPHIANEWHPILNDCLPSDVASHSHKKVWWQCSRGHDWEAVINNRTSCGNGCPYCSGRLPTKTSSLGFLRPDLAEEWHPKNQMNPFDVTQFSHKRVWWKCSQGHEWRCEIANRTNLNSGCPYCKGTLPTCETCLAATYPKISLEWHPTKNDRNPRDVSKSSSYRAWWKCSSCNHEWQTSINNRTDKDSGCPKCKLGLSTSMPEIRLWSEMVYVFGSGNVLHRYRDLGFELDVFVPVLKVGIEYDGFRWHKNYRCRDVKKYKSAKLHNIFLIRISEDPSAPADKVFVTKKMPLHVVQKVIKYVQKFDSEHRFTNNIDSYSGVKNFQNSTLFTETYDNVVRKCK